MIGQVDTVVLQRFVVRVDTPDGQIKGTGFFVAPGWVLTCAHVVAGLSDVRVVVRDAEDGVPASVTGRSADRPTGGKSQLWPFPDLALLRLGGAVEHDCVRLDVAEPGTQADCVAWGHARREDGVDPVGSPASLRFTGWEGDGFLALKADAIRPGLSGAPLVCPQRRAVVGVMTATRNKAHPLGGWAAPIKALTGDMPGVPP